MDHRLWTLKNPHTAKFEAIKAKELERINTFFTTDVVDNNLIHSRFLNPQTFAGNENFTFNNRPCSSFDPSSLAKTETQDTESNVSPASRPSDTDPQTAPSIVPKTETNSDTTPNDNRTDQSSSVSEEILAGPSIEEKCQYERNNAFDRIVNEEEKVVILKKYLGGEMVAFGDHCWRKEATSSKKGLEIFGTIPSSEIQSYQIVGQEAKILRGDRSKDQQMINSLCEVLQSTGTSLIATYKSTAIVPKICVLQPTECRRQNTSGKLGYAMNMLFLPSSATYRKLPEEDIGSICDHEGCHDTESKESVDEAMYNTIQDYIGKVSLLHSRLNFYIYKIKIYI